MRFEFAVGNPPYQEEVANNGRQSPLYDKFMESAYKLADCVELITPARFLFDAGQTDKKWNKKMLNDEHLKPLMYEADGSKIFPNTDIKGGIVITIRCTNKQFGKIGIFTAYPQLNGILQKVSVIDEGKAGLNHIISSQGIYRFSDKLFVDYPKVETLLGDGTGAKIISRIVNQIPEIFMDVPDSSVPCIRLFAKTKAGRLSRYIKTEYLQENPHIGTYNVLISESNGTGPFEALAPPIIANPYDGSADTFLSIGTFTTKGEAENLNKYIKTKFARALLGVKKATHHTGKHVWEYVPTQNFTDESDIDWSVSISEIDQQLYKKYGLSDEEIVFIETNVKEMK